jgi:tRNA U34 5-methylaminomethyl-2-thiouridine-forming methyltransferase MnmC
MKLREHHALRAFSLRCSPFAESEISRISSAWARIAIHTPDRIGSHIIKHDKVSHEEISENRGCRVTGK